MRSMKRSASGHPRTGFLVLLTVLFLLYGSIAAFAAGPTSVKMVKKDGKSYLYDRHTNKPVKGYTGRQEMPAGSGRHYYFINNKGQIYTKTWFRVDNKVYYAGPWGQLRSGWSAIGKKTRIFYFNPSTNVRVTGWKKIDGAMRYFNKNGLLQTGFKKIGKFTYYLDPEKQGAKTIGWKKISGKVYCFNSRGRMKKGLKKVDGSTYYFDSTGVRRTGLRNINGSIYYFNKSTGKMETGWKTVNGRKYYFSSSGKAVTGWYTNGSKKYYFSSKGVMQTGWVTLNSRKYYFNPANGVMFTGRKTIDGKTYNFGKDGYIEEPTGPWSIKVNQTTNVVTVYRGTTPVKALLCSVGIGGATPTGNFTILDKIQWHTLYGPCYGQYCCHLTSEILFHSVWYYRYMDNNSLATAEFNKLGEAASHGCIRLSCGDAYYIYSNCPVGTPVTIFWGTAADDPLGKPAPIRLPSSQTYDPTDPITND